MGKPLCEPHKKYAKPIDCALEQDALDHWSAVETAHQWQVIGYQDRFPYQQRGQCRGEKATELNVVLLQDQALRQ
jgi:hypothetical protein